MKDALTLLYCKAPFLTLCLRHIHTLIPVSFNELLHADPTIAIVVQLFKDIAQDISGQVLADGRQLVLVDVPGSVQIARLEQPVKVVVRVGRRLRDFAVMLFIVVSVI